jgi:Fe-S cluster assembly scaffold protein SufB
VKETRLSILEKALESPFPQSKYTKIEGFGLEDIKLEDIKLAPGEEPKNVLETAGFSTSDFSGVFVQSGYDLTFILNETRVEVMRLDASLTDTKIPVFSDSDDKFDLLSKALFRGGVFINVPRGTFLEKPFLILLCDVPFFRGIIKVGEDAKVLFYEEAISSLSGAKICVENLWVSVAENSICEISFTENLSGDKFLRSIRRGEVFDGANLRWSSFWSGGNLVLGTISDELLGVNSSLEDIQVVLGSGKQHFDLCVYLHHVGKVSKGEVYVKGVLKDSARSVFLGKAKIEKDAQNSDSYLVDHVLILSENARADSIPTMEIEANEVRAKHGASVSNIDEEQIFYIMTRGLSETEAKNTIIKGFVENYIVKFPLEIAMKRVQNIIG